MGVTSNCLAVNSCRRALNYLKEKCQNIDIFNVTGTTSINDETIREFIKSSFLSPNDQQIVEMFNEKKINKIMLINYMERKVKTVLQGKIHLLLVLASPIWITYMLHISKTLWAKIFTSIAALCMFFNFFASFLLHNFEWKPELFFLIEKIDHMGIFLMISGSCLPVPALLFNKLKFLYYIILQGLASLFGCLVICFSCFSTGNRITRACTYVIAGFLHALFLKDYLMGLVPKEIMFFIFLAALYCVGAVIYSMKKPNIIKGILGFHDVFHICCLGSGLFTMALNCSVIRRNT
ncbi:hemolysin III, putative [Plasmodium vivax]|uniref:Hemolysin III, putative n=1 Tax=Plasmodium vivax TaxID=5855 RepID=A0A1G4H237_PLAVI|nr:hemolysin III, putative [Plasmodium vivax]SCO68895.1 hemolysin III, putative [Plasmodium vivax]